MTLCECSRASNAAISKAIKHMLSISTITPGDLHPEQVMDNPFPDSIFVFGSNYAGRHGKGAARTALRRYGAKYGQGEGLQGRSYAIPTKTANLSILPIGMVSAGIREFIRFAKSRQHLTFFVTPVGCGYAGWKREDIWPYFDECSRLGHLGHKQEELTRRVYFAASWLDAG